MVVRWIRVAGLLLLVAIPLAAIAQEKSSSSPDSAGKVGELKSGQVWKTASAATVTILKIEDLPKVGRIVHVRIENVPNGNCGSVQLTKTIEHLASTEEIVRNS